MIGDGTSGRGGDRTGRRTMASPEECRKVPEKMRLENRDRLNVPWLSVTFFNITLLVRGNDEAAVEGA